MSWKGRFKPKNPAKYAGDPTNIIYRSMWELKYMMQLDSDGAVLSWASEELAIPYVSPIDNRIHRYFVDFWVKRRDGIYLIEIKPMYQRLPPVQGKKTKRKYLNEVMTFGVNQAKWRSAEAFAKSKGWNFVVLSEAELGIKF